MKHAVIVHGYKGRSFTSWKPWLRYALELAGWTVDLPVMPEPDHPDAEAWVTQLSGAVGHPDTDTYLIGHSLGCITILRYLEELPDDQRVGGVVLVAGFGQAFERYEKGDFGQVLDTFFDHELDWVKIRRHCDQFVAIHSEDDPLVDVGQLYILGESLGARTVMVQGMKHFSMKDGVLTAPVVRDELMEIAQTK